MLAASLGTDVIYTSVKGGSGAKDLPVSSENFISNQYF